MRKAIYGVTGTRHGAVKEQKASLLIRIAKITEKLDGRFEPWLIHGGCIGVDIQTHLICKGFGWKTWVLPGPYGPDPACCDADEMEENRPFIERNHLIVDRCGAMHALPDRHTEVMRSGTWATIRYARKIRRRLVIIWPDGRVDTTDDV